MTHIGFFKKTVSAVLMSALIFCTAACSTGSNGSSSENSASADEATTAVHTTAVPTTATEVQITADDPKIKSSLEALSEMGFSGVLYAERDGKPIASFASGTLYDDMPITLETPMPVGSVSKQFCAAAIMLLQEQGKLSVNDKLDKYFPEYKEGGRITLHNMLSMLSGIPDLPEKEKEVKALSEQVTLDNTDEQNTAALKKYIFSKQLEHEPGEKFKYSNFNYILLGNIVEKVTGKVYIDFLRESFFEPLGMEHTGSIFELKDSPEWARAFHYEPSELSFGIEPGTAKGAGDIISTAADMTKWMNMLPSGKIISEDSYKAMTTSYSSDNYGYGLNTKISSGIGHFGSIGHFNSAETFNTDKKLTVFMAMNTGGQTMVTNTMFSLLGVLENL